MIGPEPTPDRVSDPNGPDAPLALGLLRPDLTRARSTPADRQQPHNLTGPYGR